MKITFKVEGLADCEAALKALPKGADKRVLRKALLAAAAPIEAAAKANVTRRSGALFKSLTIGTKLTDRQKKLFKKQSTVEVSVGAGPLAHAHMVEFGSAHHTPTGFMRKAVDSQGRAAIDTFVETVKAEIKRVTAFYERKAARLAAKIAAAKVR